MNDLLGHVLSLSPPQWIAVLGASIAAAFFDARRRIIPNAISLPALLLGLLWQAWSAGALGLAEATGAALLVSAPYLLLYAFAGGGGGDVKLMAAHGAWLGLGAGIVMLFFTALWGIALGIVFAVRRRRLVGRTGASSQTNEPERPIDPVADPNLIPYGLAICAGAITTCSIALLG